MRKLLSIICFATLLGILVLPVFAVGPQAQVDVDIKCKVLPKIVLKVDSGAVTATATNGETKKMEVNNGDVVPVLPPGACTVVTPFTISVWSNDNYNLKVKGNYHSKWPDTDLQIGATPYVGFVEGTEYPFFTGTRPATTGSTPDTFTANIQQIFYWNDRPGDYLFTASFIAAQP